MSDLEERVAALEAALIAPLLLSPSSEAWTKEQIAEFREKLAEAAGRHEMRLIPLPPPLTPDQVRYLLRECVTAVKPGEHLILRVPWSTAPTQVRELQKYVTQMTEWLELPFKMLILPGDELATAQPEEVHGAT